jgi:hypothetical protein
LALSISNFGFRISDFHPPKDGNRDQLQGQDPSSATALNDRCTEKDFNYSNASRAVSRIERPGGGHVIVADPDCRRRLLSLLAVFWTCR